METIEVWQFSYSGEELKDESITVSSNDEVVTFEEMQNNK